MADMIHANRNPLKAFPKNHFAQDSSMVSYVLHRDCPIWLVWKMKGKTKKKKVRFNK